MFYLPISLTVAGAAAILNLWLAIRVIRQRFAARVLIGDGGDARLAARMRAQANFAEYTPIVLILIALIELARGSALALWIAAMLYLVGRILHPFGMDGWRIGRTIGTALTFTVMTGLGLYAAWLGYAGLDPLR